MPSSEHPPYGMDRTQSPFGDGEDQDSSLLSSGAGRRAPRSVRDSPNNAAAVVPALRSPNHRALEHPLSGSGSRLGSGSGRGGATPPLSAAAVQRRLSDFNGSGSGFMSSCLSPSVSSRRTHQAAPSPMALPAALQTSLMDDTPTPSTVAALHPSEMQKGQEEEQQQQQPTPSHHVPSPPRRVLSPSPDQPLPEMERLPSAKSAADGANATQPPTATTRRTVAFADSALFDTAHPAHQSSSGFNDPRASLLAASDSRTTQRPSDVSTQVAPLASDSLDVTVPKEEEAASVDTTLHVTEPTTATAAAAATTPEAAKPNDALKKEGSSTSPHSRKTGAYAHLVIQKPFPSNATEPPCDATAAAAAAAGSAGTIPTMAGGDPTAEAQIRAAGTGNANLLPVFDRAKQALLSPGLGSALTPRLRHGRTNSGRVDGPHDMANATPKSSSGRAFSTLITPLLRTPMWRQQSSGANSPLIVDRAVLEEPARSPATFGDRLKEMHDDGAGVTTHMVWQTREGQTRCILSPSFLLVAEHDRVCVHWYDGEEEVFETDHTYLNVVPGGRHSCYNSASTPNGTPAPAASQHDGTAHSMEMQAVWNAPAEDGNRLEMSHALGLRAAGVGTTSTESTDVVTVRPQLEKMNTKSGSTPLVIRVRTPRHGRVDSLSFADDTGVGGAGAGGLTASSALARAGLRARRPASEVFLARDDDAAAVAVAAAGVDGSHLLSARSDANQREVNMFASNATPLVTGHSRQASANWMLQRSATRQSLGENYQSFTVAFPKPGDYYFVCSKHKRTMRLQVQVQSRRSAVAWRYILLIGAAVLVVALIVIVVVVLAYWMQHSTYLFGEKDTATYEQYLAFLDIHDLITMKLFPFLAVCILIILIVILAAIGWSVFRCFHPARQGAYTRGIYANTRRVLHLGTVLLTFALIVLLFVAFGLEMNVMNGVNELALSIGSGVTSTLNMYSTAVLQVNFVVNETSVLFPNISLPTDQIYTITGEVSTLMNQIVRWTSFIEDIAQVAFRIIPIVIYLSMQLGLFAACLTIGAIILRFRKAAVATTWMLAASVGVFSLVCGIEYTVTQLFSTVYSSVVVLRDDPQDFGATLGLANDSFVSQLLSYCAISVDDVSVISKYVNEILSGINNTLDAEGQKEFSAVFQFVQNVVPNTLEALANYTDYIIANLDALQNILDKNGQQVDDAVQQNVVPLLKAALSVIQTFEGLVNCQVIRDIVAAAIPIFKDEVQNYNLAVFSFLLIVFGISFILLVFSTGATYALRHPRRTWCNMRTGRWFRFRYSYKTHLNTLMMGAETKARKKTVLQWLVLHTEPIMYQLQSTMLVCYSACALMFFDCILIVLFNEVSRGTRTSKMLQALSYLGCAVLFFLLLAALFRRAILRRIVHICALLCAAACLGVSVSQAIVGYVYFAECLDHTRYETSSLTYGSPVYMTCSATYMGYNLEVAIYSTIIFLNSVTLLVTLAIQIRYERHLKASFAHRHYVGVLSPLEKFFPWLKCIFVDYLFVKRIYHGLLIAVIVIFLILFAVLDIGQWSVIRGVTRPTIGNSDIVQVIDPNVGCNGDSQYCDLRANEIIWACAHNAHSSLEDGFVLPNHYYNITHQLQAGIRSFMVDVWYDKINSTISDAVDVYVCHTLCLVGRRLWRDIAREFKQFLDQYPEQVIMIIFEQYVNSSSLGEISDEVGLTQYAWLSDQVAPNFNPDYEWPTLRQLINKGQRALMYNDVMAYLPMSRDCPEWLYYSFDFQYENYYQTNSVSEWVCDIHRGWCTADPTVVNCDDSGSSSNSACAYNSSSSSSSLPHSSESSSSDSRLEYLKAIDVTNCTVYGADPLWHNGSAVYNAAFRTNPPNVRSKMSTMNHFITNGVGSPVQATKANQQQQVQSTTYMCSSTWNTVVNILAFDFWNIANPLGTIEAMNQNIARYGARYGFANEWSRMLFGTDTVAFDEDT